jgi:hypothetical protein
VANLPAVKTESSISPWHEKVVDLLIDGNTPAEIGRKLHPDDKKAARSFAWRLRKLVRVNPLFTAAIAEAAKAEMVLNVGATVPAIVKRARRGRPDAIKLLWEATDFHNPKVQHEHSGDVSISIKLPRPDQSDVPQPTAQAIEAEVIEDAEVVD